MKTCSSDPGAVCTAMTKPCQMLMWFTVLLLVPCQVAADDLARGERLFRITRNKNDNIVCYDVIRKGRKLDEDNPVSVYWVIPSDNYKVESLNFVERRRAYGVNVEEAFGQDSVDITLAASERVIRVRMRGDRWLALTNLGSREVAVDSIYIMADESSTMPAVKWVEVMGTDARTGADVSEKIMK